MTDTHTTALIPDEAVQAANLAYCRTMDATDDFNASIRSAIIAALPYLSAPCADKPVDVAAVRKQAFEEGFDDAVEQSLNALNAYDDITRIEAEQSIRILKPDYRALSADNIELTKERIPQDAIDNLSSCQTQLDADGCMVGVSRQALEEALSFFRALSAEPAQGGQCNHITDVSKMVDALKETRIDLVILQGNVADAAKTNSNWEGMPARIRLWIDRIDAALPTAPTTEAGK